MTPTSQPSALSVPLARLNYHSRGGGWKREEKRGEDPEGREGEGRGGEGGKGRGGEGRGEGEGGESKRS